MKRRTNKNTCRRCDTPIDRPKAKLCTYCEAEDRARDGSPIADPGIEVGGTTHKPPTEEKEMTEVSDAAIEAGFQGVLRRYGDREDMDHPLIRQYVTGILEDARPELFEEFFQQCIALVVEVKSERGEEGFGTDLEAVLTHLREKQKREGAGK